MVVLSNGGPSLNVADMFKFHSENYKLGCPYSGLELHGEQSVSIMQLILISLLELDWYRGWVSLLDEIDESIKVQAVDILNADSSEQLLFHGSLAQSKVYFQLLQLLRIMPLWIKETRIDLVNLKTVTKTHIPTSRGHIPCMHNWDQIFKRFTELEEELLSRIETKTEEIRGLRDGMNRYVIIFTILTIFYLPLGFVTAVFSMDLLHEEELTGMKSQYAATMVAVSVVTYVVAIGLVMFVDRQKIRPLLSGLLANFVFLGHPLRYPFEKADPAAGFAAETNAGKASKAATPGLWAALWASSGLNLRQRRKKDKGKAAEAPELGIHLDAVDAASFITPNSRDEEGRAVSEVHLPTRSNTLTSRTRSSRLNKAVPKPALAPTGPTLVSLFDLFKPAGALL
ncbi:hypothetical protein B0I37DRAFT_357382 [Chaetomium sp. MPI-CAGE-AT-0009]|nr:hypothetical protein B0I37DRAFT_357382 [Chaetomium sp. MPI-CAGE-AT-0009]